MGAEYKYPLPSLWVSSLSGACSGLCPEVAQWDEALVAHSGNRLTERPLSASSRLCLTSPLPYWHFLGCLQNKRLVIGSLSQAVLLGEPLGDGGGTQGAIVTHQWLNPTGIEKAWEPTVEVRGSNLLRQTAGEGRRVGLEEQGVKSHLVALAIQWRRQMI